MTRVLLIRQPGEADDAPTRAQLGSLSIRVPLQVVVGTCTTLAEIADELDSAPGTSVAVLSTGLHAADDVLLRILDDPALTLATLVSSTPGPHPVATQGAAVLSAAAAHHQVPGADATGLGAVFLDASVVAAAARALRAVCASSDDGDVLDLMLATLVRAPDLPTVTAVRAEPFPAVRTTARRDALPAVTDRDLAARTAARPGDGFYSTFVLRRISSRLTPWAVRHGIAPNTVTAVSAVIGVAGAAAFALGSYPALVAGAVLLQVSIVLDCVDGEIARATRTRSQFGGWLDAATDRIKEYAALAGLALAGHQLWTLAAAAMVVQTVRHMHDFAFDKLVVTSWRASFRDRRPMSDTAPWQPPDGWTPGPELLRGSAGMWARRLIRMPIGERWLVLSIAALLDRPWLGLTLYLALTALAWLWTLLGAIRRTRTSQGRYGTAVRRTLADYRDDGMLAFAVGGRSPQGVTGWFLPALVTAIEGAAVVAVTAAYAPEWRAAAFGWFAVVAWHRYDVAYRRAGPSPDVPAVVSMAGLGWLVRAAIVGAAAAAGALPVVLCAGIAWFGLCFVPESLWAGWRTRAGGATR